MITIPRALARQFRAVLRKAVPAAAGRGRRPPVLLLAGDDGLRVRAQDPDVAVEYHDSDPRPTDTIALPGAALDDFEGGKDDLVVLEKMTAEAVQARWDDRGVPQVRDYAVTDSDSLPPFPEAPAECSPMEGNFLQALHEAGRTSARDGIRFAIQKVQLRGAARRVVGTDGRQLLIQGGFALPWKEDLLVPAVPAFGAKELPREAAVTLGRTDTHVCVRVGPWAFHLTIDKDGRFPEVERVVPTLTKGMTTCRLSADDAAFLVDALPRLPGRGDGGYEPVTVDLNGTVTVRARDAGQDRVSEVVLRGSEAIGPPVRFCTDRQYLARAVQLGFTEFHVLKPDVPIVCRDEHRTYVWVPLTKEAALPPAEDHPGTAAPEESSPTTEPNERSPVTMTKPPGNGHGNGPPDAPTPARSGDATRADGGANGVGIDALIAEALALKDVMRDGYERANRLVAGLKRHRKQSQLVASTLASLRQLQGLGG